MPSLKLADLEIVRLKTSKNSAKLESRERQGALPLTN